MHRCTQLTLAPKCMLRSHIYTVSPTHNYLSHAHTGTSTRQQTGTYSYTHGDSRKRRQPHAHTRRRHTCRCIHSRRLHVTSSEHLPEPLRGNKPSIPGPAARAQDRALLPRSWDAAGGKRHGEHAGPKQSAAQAWDTEESMRTVLMPHGLRPCLAEGHILPGLPRPRRAHVCGTKESTTEGEGDRAQPRGH